MTRNDNKTEDFGLNKMFDEAYNMGIDASIKLVKAVTLPDGFTQIQDFKNLITNYLQQLKKEIKP